MKNYSYISQFEPYGNAKKYRLSKNILRFLWVSFFVIIPFVTPLSVFAPKVFKKDLLVIRRY